jgi:monofunctional glycosyltransferase
LQQPKPLRLTTKGIVPKIWRVVKRVFFWLFIFQFVYILYGRWCNPPITFTQLGSALGGYGLKRDYVSLENISPHLRLAVIVSEDQQFPDHEGIDWDAVQGAIEYNKKHKNKIGGSTISQQTAKNFFLWQGGGFFRKGLEAYFTKMIEWTWSKRRILEAYLNIIEMGKGIFGAEAAARHHFGKSAKDLTREEAAQIAACLPNPKQRTIKPLHPKVAKRARWILRQMRNIEGDPDIQELLK